MTAGGLEGSLGDEKVWPPGFRFHPTDEELVLYYLKRKICGKKVQLNIIGETDVYKWDPEELPGQSLLRTGDRQWFFFSPRDRKYPNAARSNRATRHGYWKATGKDRIVKCNSRNVGVKKTLVFYKGRAPSGERTDWVMHEYTLDEEELKRCLNVKDYYALYKVFKKSGPGPKNGEQYGAPFKEEDWADNENAQCNGFDDQEMLMKQLSNVSSPADKRENGEDFSSFDDFDIVKEIENQILNDSPAVNDQSSALPQVVGVEETESDLVDPYIDELLLPEPVEMCNTNSETCDVQRSLAYTPPAGSLLQSHDGLEVASAPKFQDLLLLPEGDFLEVADLLGPEPKTSSNTDRPLENIHLGEIDELSEFDRFHDATMFLHDMGPVDHEALSGIYLPDHGNDIVDQWNYQPPPNPYSATLINDQIWMDNQASSVTTLSQPLQQFVSQPATGVVYESPKVDSQNDQNQGNVSNDARSWLSSAIWNFVESIPTNPASASENALVNRALGRMSSFSRAKMSSRNTSSSASGNTERKSAVWNRGFFFFSVIGALCAILWMLIGTVRLWGRCIFP